MSTPLLRSARMLCIPFVALATACSGSNPSVTQPSPVSAATTASGVSSALSTASVAAPRPLLPVTSALIPNTSQPVTLVVQNAVVTKAGGATYTLEVATDLAFTTKVQTKDAVAEGSGGQTSVKLDTLTPNTTYYWHARATGGGTTGVFGAIFSFKVGPAIIINAPVPIAPLTNTQTIPRPALRVTNAVRTGPAGPLTYRFEISTTSSFTSILVTGTNTEGPNETGFLLTTDLPTNSLLYWRAVAIDVANSITSAPSAVQSFTANLPSQAALIAQQLGITLWPGVQPPGTIGHATMGQDWVVEPITSFDGVTFINPPLDELQIFDLIDRGLSAPDAVQWMKDHGYSSVAVWYPDVQVIAFAYEYMAFINGQWSIVIRAGA